MSTIAASVPATRPTSARRARWLLADALVSGTSGVVLAAGAAALDGPLGAPAGALVGIGLFCLAYAASLVLLARRGSPSAMVRLIGVGNLGWSRSRPPSSRPTCSRWRPRASSSAPSRGRPSSCWRRDSS